MAEEKTEKKPKTAPPKDTVKEGKKKKQPGASTQKFLKISEIRDDTLVLKNGGLRAVLRTSSINFNLKSEEEQNAIIMSYQGFLNSLEFPIQIMIRSKKLDIDNYIDKIKSIGEKQTNPLLQNQTTEYADYIQKLVEYADIMEKDFLIVVPFDPARAIGVSFIQKFIQNFSQQDSVANIKKRHAEFEQLSKGLSQRVSTVKGALESCGLKVEQLNTQSLIELFYNIYNPSISRNEKVKDPSNLNLKNDDEQIALDK
jgi:type IV secretory pathway VirB4 component